MIMNNLEVKDFRKKYNLNQSDLAELTGVSLRTVKSWEYGERNISSSAIKIIKAFIEKELSETSINSTVTQVPTDDYIMVEFVDLRATAGYIGGEAVENLPDTHTRLIPKEYSKGKYLVIRVDGDSMDDGTKRSISDGDELLIKERDLSENNLDVLPIKTALFVLTTREGNVVKQIKEINKDGGYITLHSFNTKFEDYKVAIEDIFQIFIVCKIVNKSITL